MLRPLFLGFFARTLPFFAGNLEGHGQWAEQNEKPTPAEGSSLIAQYSRGVVDVIIDHTEHEDVVVDTHANFIDRENQNPERPAF